MIHELGKLLFKLNIHHAYFYKYFDEYYIRLGIADIMKLRVVRNLLYDYGYLNVKVGMGFLFGYNGTLQVYEYVSYKHTVFIQNVLWLFGISRHNKLADECCPDFSCCYSNLKKNLFKRCKYFFSSSNPIHFKSTTIYIRERR